MAIDQDRSQVLRLDRGSLIGAIHRAFVESRFTEPAQPMYVNIHADGSVFVSRFKLHMTEEGFSILAVRCLATAEVSGKVMSDGTPWTRAGFSRWVASKTDKFLSPAMEDLKYQANRWRIRLILMDGVRE
jgi:hypothetical protein